MKGDTELKKAKEYLKTLSEAMEFLMTSEQLKDLIQPSTLKIIREALREKFNVDVKEYELLLEAQDKTITWSDKEDELVVNYLSKLPNVSSWNDEWIRVDNLVLLTGRSKQVIKKHVLQLGLEGKLIKS